MPTPTVGQATGFTGAVKGGIGYEVIERLAAFLAEEKEDAREKAKEKGFRGTYWEAVRDFFKSNEAMPWDVITHKQKVFGINAAVMLGCVPTVAYRKFPDGSMMFEVVEGDKWKKKEKPAGRVKAPRFSWTREK